MKIGPFVISRVRRTKAGLVIYPWQALTEDRVSPELRQIVAKVARSEVKSLLQDIQEEGGRVCTGPHQCRPDTERVVWCRESCSLCMGNDVKPCRINHTRVWGAV